MSLADGFEEFVATADAGSLTAAAEQLGIPRPTLSRRLARLEQTLGVVLIQRTTRSLQLTPAGERFYPKARYVVETAQEAHAEIARLDGQPKGTLRVTVPTEMPRTIWVQWIQEFLERYPQVQLEVLGAAEHEDLLSGGVDVALRAKVPEDAPVIIRTLIWNHWVAVASPEYLSRYGVPAAPEDLADHTCILGYPAGQRPQTQWPLLAGGSVPVQGRLALNQMGVRLEAARQGLGIALVMENLAEADLETGDLLRVLPEQIGGRERLCLAYADRRLLDPKIRAFVDFVSERILAIRGGHRPNPDRPEPQGPAGPADPGCTDD